MSETIYKFGGHTSPSGSDGVRWVNVDELELFNRHLSLCGQRQLSQAVWDDIYAAGTIYCLRFVEGIPVGRACVEKYSDEFWEVSDVRTAKDYRNRGYATETCAFVMNYILHCGKTPTIRTEDDNYSMKRIIEKLGFFPIE